MQQCDTEFESQLVVESLLEATPEPMLVMNEHAVIERVNSATEEVFGYERERLLGQKVEFLIPQRFRAGHVTLRDGFMAHPERDRLGGIEGRQVYGQRASGEEFPIQLSINPTYIQGRRVVIALARDITREVALNESLQQREQLYRNLVESVPGTVYQASFDGKRKMSVLSEDIEALTGWPLQNFGEYAADYYDRSIPEEDRTKLYSAIRQSATSGEMYELIYPLKGADGEIRHVRDRGNVIMAGDSTLGDLQVVGTLVDVSEELQAAEILRRERRQFRLMLESSPLAAAFTVDGIFHYCNPAMEALFGTQQGERADQIYIDLSDRERMLAALETTGEWIGNELDLFDRYGKPRKVLTFYFTLELAGQSGVLGWLYDVTESRAAEAALKESEQRLRNTALAADVGLWEYTADDDLVLVNETTLELFGWSSEKLELHQEGWFALPYGLAGAFEVVHPDYREQFESDFRKHLKGESEVFFVEHKVPLPDGGSRWIRTVGRALQRDSQGLAVGVDGVVSDIDTEKRLQQELIDARDEALRANNAKSEFLAKITHEIRTPISALMGLTHLARKVNDADKLDYYLSTAERSTDYVARIINDILDFSKIEAGKIELESVAFDLKETFDYCLTLLEVKSTQADVKLTMNVAPDVPLTLCGDPYRLQQILINLVGNAIKFSNPGGVVEIRVERDLDGPCEAVGLHIAVNDQGIGMTQEEARYLFQAYQQASASVTRTHGGTGLGLAISRQLTEMMGGRIWVESEKGVGSTFHFTACFQVQSLLAEGAAQSDEDALDPQLGSIEGLRVLVVEDHPDVQEMVHDLLEIEGMHVSVASNGLEALEHLQSNTVDVVLMDCQMPVMNGFEAATEIRRNPALKNLPVIAMTGNVGEDDISRVMEAGMSDHIGKPVDPEDLLQRLARIAAQK